ncbi:MAG: tetratricopeptide repeat protein [Ignavibacteriaceae bacterium]|jgi:tetratricopeptide (TPR) repeat protein
MKKMARLFYCLLCASFITSALIAQTMDSAAVKPFNDGLDKIQKNDFTGALTDFQQALAASKDYRIYYQLGVVNEKLNKPDDAIANYKSTIAAKPDFEAVYNNLGSVYFAQGKYQDAADNFQQVLKTSQDSTLKANVSFNITLAYSGLATSAGKNSKKAIEYLTKAVSYTNYDLAYLNLAKNYFLINKYDKSIEAAQNALKYKKTISEGGPNYWLGVDYQKKNDAKKAKEYLTKAKEDPVYGKSAQTVLDAMAKQG